MAETQYGVRVRDVFKVHPEWVGHDELAAYYDGFDAMVDACDVDAVLADVLERTHNSIDGDGKTFSLGDWRSRIQVHGSVEDKWLLTALSAEIAGGLSDDGVALVMDVYRSFGLSAMRVAWDPLLRSLDKGDARYMVLFDYADDLFMMSVRRRSNDVVRVMGMPVKKYVFTSDGNSGDADADAARYEDADSLVFDDGHIAGLYADDDDAERNVVLSRFPDSAATRSLIRRVNADGDAMLVSNPYVFTADMCSWFHNHGFKDYRRMATLIADAATAAGWLTAETASSVAREVMESGDKTVFEMLCVMLDNATVPNGSVTSDMFNLQWLKRHSNVPMNVFRDSLVNGDWGDDDAMGYRSNLMELLSRVNDIITGELEAELESTSTSAGNVDNGDSSGEDDDNDSGSETVSKRSVVISGFLTNNDDALVDEALASVEGTILDPEVETDKLSDMKDYQIHVATLPSAGKRRVTLTDYPNHTYALRSLSNADKHAVLADPVLPLCIAVSNYRFLYGLDSLLLRFITELAGHSLRTITGEDYSWYSTPMIHPASGKLSAAQYKALCGIVAKLAESDDDTLTRLLHTPAYKPNTLEAGDEVNLTLFAAVSGGEPDVTVSDDTITDVDVANVRPWNTILVSPAETSSESYYTPWSRNLLGLVEELGIILTDDPSSDAGRTVLERYTAWVNAANTLNEAWFKYHRLNVEPTGNKGRSEQAFVIVPVNQNGSSNIKYGYDSDIVMNYVKGAPASVFRVTPEEKAWLAKGTVPTTVTLRRTHVTVNGTRDDSLSVAKAHRVDLFNPDHSDAMIRWVQRNTMTDYYDALNTTVPDYYQQ